MIKKIKLLGAVITMLLLLSSSTTKKNTSPNILIIMTDDQGYGDVSYVGTKDIQTPYIDALAKSGVILNNFHANSSVCSPSRASLLSGKYPCKAGVPGVIRDYKSGNMGYLDPNTTLLPKELKQNGYNTSIIGKWHLGTEAPNLPNDRGFDHFHGWLSGMMNDYWTHLQRKKNYLRLNEKEVFGNGLHATDLFTKWALERIDHDIKEDNPFFMFLAYTAPHDPVQPPKDWLDKVLKREKGIDTARASLVALVEHLDWNIGKVISKLEKEKQLENTIIFFVSDNGGSLKCKANNGPNRDGKASMYEGGLRVPALASWKGKIKPNQTSEQLLLTMDIFPTVLEMAGISSDLKIDGISFWNELQNPSTDNKHKADFRYFQRRESFAQAAQVNTAVIKNELKLVHNDPFGPLELFNLKIDPEEKNDLLPELMLKPKKEQKPFRIVGYMPASGFNNHLSKVLK